MRGVNSRRRMAGFNLVEMMVSLSVLALGLLGMASLTSNSLRVGQTAHVYSQSMFLAQELAEKALANRANKQLYVLNFGEKGDANLEEDRCIKQACSGAEMARWDVKVWRRQVGTALPKGDAQLNLSGDVLIITIRFDASRGEEAPEEVVYQVTL
jgi:type IV pilus assembly protein PilV